MNSRLLAVIDISQPSVNPVAQFGDIGTLLNQILPTIMIAASLVFLAILLYGAFTFVTSSGEQEKIQKARKTITYSLVGLVLIFLSYLIVQVVSMITGITLFI
ncbi:MAG: hypothetical protein WAT72_01385 [Microgenomates group bacterium]|jgi:heme O synthase-like polyprenyltransferase|nr:hypothetical protein [Candidatus Woesebacteria bacterium]MBP6882984.1 hypothetical protein [Candidatus Woesebacteria bacterium]QQR63746.1 MAG: hypothetical protein IPH70_04565 [Candidatus Roizmanbacteria bacterium]